MWLFIFFFLNFDVWIWGSLSRHKFLSRVRLYLLIWRAILLSISAKSTRFDYSLGADYVLLRIIYFGLDYFLMLDFGDGLLADIFLSMRTRRHWRFVRHHRGLIFLRKRIIRIAALFFWQSWSRSFRIVEAWTFDYLNSFVNIFLYLFYFLCYSLNSIIFLDIRCLYRDIRIVIGLWRFFLAFLIIFYKLLEVIYKLIFILLDLTRFMILLWFINLQFSLAHWLWQYHYWLFFLLLFYVLFFSQWLFFLKYVNLFRLFSSSLWLGFIVQSLDNLFWLIFSLVYPFLTDNDLFILFYYFWNWYYALFLFRNLGHLLFNQFVYP